MHVQERVKDRNTGQSEMERERKGGGFRQNILVGGKEEESSSEEKSKEWILLPVISCSLFLSFGINVLLRIQQHTDDSSRLSYRTFFSQLFHLVRNM